MIDGAKAFRPVEVETGPAEKEADALMKAMVKTAEQSRTSLSLNVKYEILATKEGNKYELCFKP